MMRVLKRLLALCGKATRLLVERYVLIEGIIPDSDLTARLLLVGRTEFMNHVAATELDSPSIVNQGVLIAPLVACFLRRRNARFDLAFVSTARLYWPALKVCGAREGAAWVHQVIDTSGGWDVVRNNFSRQMRERTNRFTEKTGLTVRLADSVSDFRWFYEEMWRPMISERFGDAAAFETVDQIVSMRDEGARIMYVELGAEVASAALFRIDGDVLDFRRIGLSPGSEGSLRTNARMALYYFLLRMATDRRLRLFDCTVSRPFLSDGVLQHKVQFGAKIVALRKSRLSAIGVVVGSDLARNAALLAVRPLIVEADEGIRVLGGLRTGDDETRRRRADNLRKRAASAGLRCIEWHHVDGAVVVEHLP